MTKTPLALKQDGSNIITRLEQLDLLTGKHYHEQLLSVAMAVRDLNNGFMELVGQLRSDLNAAFEAESESESENSFWLDTKETKKDWKN